MNYAKITTEQINPRTKNIDTLTIPQIVRAIFREDQTVPRAVWSRRRPIAQAVTLIVQALRSGKRLFFVGAGTSGRLGVMEAAECPPTFHTPPSQIQAIMAGGKSAVFQSREGAEDNADEGRAAIRKRAKPGDIVAGIAASGVTPFALAALQAAKNLHCHTLLITCNPAWKNQVSGFKPDVTIALNTGPEAIAGSTRMKAGSAAKMTLNMLTTASMIRLGKIYGNRMVDLEMNSLKLKERAIRIVCELAGVDRTSALRCLNLAHGRTKIAVVMAKRRTGYPQAMRLLDKCNGFLQKALS